MLSGNFLFSLQFTYSTPGFHLGKKGWPFQLPSSLIRGLPGFLLLPMPNISLKRRPKSLIQFLQDTPEDTPLGCHPNHHLAVVPVQSTDRPVSCFSHFLIPSPTVYPPSHSFEMESSVIHSAWVECQSFTLSNFQKSCQAQSG